MKEIYLFIKALMKALKALLSLMLLDIVNLILKCLVSIKNIKIFSKIKKLLFKNYERCLNLSLISIFTKFTNYLFYS